MNRRNRQKSKLACKYSFHDRELRELSSVFAQFIHDGLFQFKNLNRCGIPANDVDENTWENIIDDMIWSFNEISKDYVNSPYNIAFDKYWEDKSVDDKCRLIEDNEFICDFEYTDELKEQNELYYDKINKGLSLFAKYFSYLWD